MESIEILNERLAEYFGKDSNTSQPIFRIVWSDEQTEMRRVDFTESGIQLLTPRVMECKKYPYIRHMYVLERLVVIPDINVKDLPTTKLSYEPLWTFCDADRNPVPPVWPAAKFVIDTLYAALGKQSMAKYVDPDQTAESRNARIASLHQELFGNDTEVSDALHYKEGIVVPSNYKKEEIN